MSMPDTVYVIYIASTAQKVWDALTSREISKQFFFGRSIELECREGAPFVLRMEDGRVDTQGKVLACDPPRKLSVSWHVEWLEEFRHLPESIVTFDIEPIGDTVRLTMTESHPHDFDQKFLEGGRKGWPMILSGLKTIVETGRQLDLSKVKFDVET